MLGLGGYQIEVEDGQGVLMLVHFLELLEVLGSMVIVLQSVVQEVDTINSLRRFEWPGSDEVGLVRSG